MADTLFDYTSEGCTLDEDGSTKICPSSTTNGIYAMEDDDATSYFYRGDVDNLVQFGEYGSDTMCTNIMVMILYH